MLASSSPTLLPSLLPPHRCSSAPQLFPTFFACVLLWHSLLCATLCGPLAHPAAFLCTALFSQIHTLSLSDSSVRLIQAFSSESFFWAAGAMAGQGTRVATRLASSLPA